MKADAPSSHRSATFSPVVFVYLGVIIVTWAGNWPLMKLALGQVPPLVFVLLRLIGSLALMGPALLLARQSLLPPRGERLGLFWVGQLQVAGFLICSIIGLAILPAGRAIVLAYTMPLWAIPIGLFLWREPLPRNQLAGAAIGFAGLVLFMNHTLVDLRNGQVLTGNSLLLLATFAWAPASAFCLPTTTSPVEMPMRVSIPGNRVEPVRSGTRREMPRGQQVDPRDRIAGAARRFRILPAQAPPL